MPAPNIQDKDLVVIYHADCQDGFCSAWAFHKKYPNASYIPARHGTKPPDNLEGKHVVIVDFSYKEAELIGIHSEALSLTVLDHHQSAYDALNKLSYCHFDMSKSGARLAWEFLNGKKKSPWIVDYVEDQDLWKWELPHSKEMNAVLSVYLHSYKEWDHLATQKHTSFITQGKVLLKYREQLVREHVSKAFQIRIGDHLVMAANCSCRSIISDVAGQLAVGHPFGATYFVDEQRHKCWSLRSTDDGEDVAAIAKKYGGGGHPHAAGFRVIS
jgi:oligoribonuclease NrnB/cAMP/cGMP phosphodiesterase (DHH superfamily)